MVLQLLPIDGAQVAGSWSPLFHSDWEENIYIIEWILKNEARLGLKKKKKHTCAILWDHIILTSQDQSYIMLNELGSLAISMHIFEDGWEKNWPFTQGIKDGPSGVE